MLLLLKTLGRTFQTLVDLFKKDFWYVAVLHCLVVKVWWLGSDDLVSLPLLLSDGSISYLNQILSFF